MTQLERLIARLVQLVEDNPGQIITLTIFVDRERIPIGWQAAQARAEGLQMEKQEPQKPLFNS
jgi:hypothetical protein